MNEPKRRRLVVWVDMYERDSQPLGRPTSRRVLENRVYRRCEIVVIV